MNTYRFDPADNSIKTIDWPGLINAIKKSEGVLRGQIISAARSDPDEEAARWANRLPGLPMPDPGLVVLMAKFDGLQETIVFDGRAMGMAMLLLKIPSEG